MTPWRSRFWLWVWVGVVVVLMSGAWGQLFRLNVSQLPSPGLVQAAQPPTEVLAFIGPSQYRGKTVSQVKVLSGEKLIALTFDDGPWGKSTEQVLAILNQHEVKATFFWVGTHLQRYPEVARNVIKAGHAVGNHSWSHTYQPMSEEVAKKEIENTSYLIAKTTQAQTRLFRPPGGILTNGLVEYATKKKYTTLMWSVDPQDSAPKVTAAEIVKRVVSKSKPGGIILLHDGGGDRRETIKALPTLITQLKAQGYTFVTIPELLQAGVKPPTPTPTPVASPLPSPNPSAPPSSSPSLEVSPELAATPTPDPALKINLDPSLNTP